MKARRLLAVLACLLVACSSDKVAGTNDETHTETARIFKSNGMIPASGAVVKVVPRDSTQAVAVGSVDSSGHVVTSLVPDGVFMVTVSLDGQSLVLDSISTSGGKLALSKDDTLEPSGTLSGIVAVQPQDDPSAVTVQVLGTEVYANVQGDGSFTLGGLSTGTARLRLVTSLGNYTTTFYAAKAANGAATRIADTIHMVYTGIPVVTGLSVANDSATGDLLLGWSAATYSRILDYLVYRDTAGSISYSTTPFAAASGTSWRDTTAGAFAQRRSWRYRVALRSTSGTAGGWLGSATGTSVPPEMRRYDSVAWTKVGTAGAVSGSVGSTMATASVPSGSTTRTFSVRSSSDGLVWDSTGTSIPVLQLGRTIEWVPGIGAGKAWCLGHSDIEDGIQLRVHDGTSWTSATLDESFWVGTGALLLGSAERIALTLSSSSPKIAWSAGDGAWTLVQAHGRILGASDLGIYTDGGGAHLLLVSWTAPDSVRRDLGIPPEAATAMVEWNGRPAFAGPHGMWVLDPDGWALRRSPSTISVETMNSNILLSDSTGNLWNGTLK